jgi:hypothetical protein
MGTGIRRVARPRRTQIRVSVQGERATFAQLRPVRGIGGQSNGGNGMALKPPRYRSSRDPVVMGAPPWLLGQLIAPAWRTQTPVVAASARAYLRPCRRMPPPNEACRR